jgi:membrane protein DedA with SNARE-associated domain
MMDIASLITLLALLLVKEAGVPIPVPGDLLVLGAGIAAAGRGLDALAELVAILLVGYVGGGLQFSLVRGTLRRPLLRILARVGVPPSRLDALAGWLKVRGSRGVALARMTPGLRIGAIAASGLAALRFPVFMRGLAAGNAVFVGGHFLLGFAVGAPALRLLSGAGGLAPAAALTLLVAAAGAAGWRRLARRGRAASAEPAPISEPAGTGYGDWADAACPACLAFALLGRDTLV